MKRWHDTEHTWEVIYTVAGNGSIIDEQGQPLYKLPQADLYRVGGAPLLLWLETNGHTKKIGRKFVPTFASFTADLDSSAAALAERPELVAAVIINDRRMVKAAKKCGFRVIYSPDRADHEIFAPIYGLEPLRGPLKVGWAGSVAWWGTVKHTDLIQFACREFPGEVEYVRQDREIEGMKNADEMALWYNKLDVLVNLNDERTCTPVTQIEAMACGIPVITTRCGEQWQLIESLWPQRIIQHPTQAALEKVLAHCVELGRDRLRESGMSFRKRFMEKNISWQCGEARRVTQALVEVARNV